MQRSRAQERRRLGASPNMIISMETVVQPADIPMAIPLWVKVPSKPTVEHNQST